MDKRRSTLSRPVIALDMDGVMCEAPQAAHITRLNEEFGTSYTLQDVTDFEYTFLSPEHRDWIFSDKGWQREDLYDRDELSISKLRVLAELRSMGRVIAVTSPMVGHIKSKYVWLLKYFNRLDVYICCDKTLVGADVLVDDAIKNLTAWPDQNAAICYNQPWNKEWTGRRVWSFDQIPNEVGQVLSGRG